jgi:NitT/TauT family transport system permease protein
MLEKLGNLFQIRQPLPGLLGLGLALVFTGLVLMAWWGITRGPVEERVVSSVILPSPQEIAESLPDLINRRQLFDNIQVSLVRVIKGWGMALLLVIPLGLLMGAFGPVRAFFGPLNVIAGYLPLITIIPLTFAWFQGESQKLAFLTMACFFFMLPLVIAAIDDIEEIFLNTAQTLGARRHDLLLKVLFPMALPEIYNAARLAFGVGWTWIIVAESLLADAGIGFIFMSSYRFEKPHMYWTALIILLIGFAADQLLGWLGRRLFPYRYL